MKQKISRLIACILFIASLIGLFTGVTLEVKAAPAVKKIKAMSAFPKNVVYSEPLLQFIERFNNKAKGKAVIEFVGGPEAIRAFDLMNSLSSGVVDFIYSPANYYEHLVPETTSLRIIPRPTPAGERSSGYYDYINDVHQKRVNAYYLGHADQMGYVFYTVKAFAKISDFKGLQMRSSPSYVAFLKALGAKAVVIAMPETYSALERGVADGLGLPFVGSVDYGFAEVIKYYITHPFMVSDGSFVINLDTWNSLSKDLQDLMKEIAVEIEKEISARNKRILDKEENALRKKGVKFVTLNKAEKDEYIKLANEAGWKHVEKVAPDAVKKLKALLEQ